jgi:hypothetical protein
MDLQESTAKHTVSADGQDPARIVVTDVVVIAPGANKARGFDRAHALLQNGRTVRLVGEGVSFAQAWPAWVQSSSGLLLTELGAYCSGDMARTCDGVRAGIVGWLRNIYGSALPGFDADVFYGDSLQRLFDEHVHFSLALPNIVKLDGPRRYHYVGAEWIALENLRALVEQAGGSLQAPPRRVSRVWPIKAAAVGCIMFAGTFVEQLRRYIAERPSRVRLRELRQQQNHLPTPALWVCMTPDWPRVNRHLIESIVSPLLKYGDSLGVLMQGKLIPGERQEFNMRRRVKGELWPGLGPVKRAFDRCTIEQVGCAESFAEFLRAAVSTFRGSMRAVTRIASGSNYIDFGALHYDVSSRLPALMKLVTQDLFNAVLVHQATLAATRRRSLSGAKVVISGPLVIAPQILVAQILEQAGATTIDFVHGTMGNRLPYRREVCSIRCVWTHADTESYADTRKNIVAGMPRVIFPNQRPAGYHARRVLFVTNYLHRDTVIGSDHPLWVYQDELMRCVSVVRERFGDRFQFRWRPHPADSEEAIVASMAGYEGIERSKGQTLAQDAAWADIAISSVSSAAIELLFADIPVFLHVRPTVAETPDVRYFAPTRCFCRANEILPEFARCVALLDAGNPEAGDAEALRPERDTLAALFGPSREPKRVYDWLQEQLHSPALQTGLNQFVPK